MALPQLSKLMTGVRFPLLAQKTNWLARSWVGQFVLWAQDKIEPRAAAREERAEVSSFSKNERRLPLPAHCFAITFDGWLAN